MNPKKLPRLEDSAFATELITLIPSINSYALNLTRNTAQAEDLVQLVLMKAWTHQDQFQIGTCMQAWLCTIMRNTHYSTSKRVGRETAFDNEGIELILNGQDRYTINDGPSTVAITKIHEALASMKPAHRQILYAVALDTPYEEIANLLGISTGTVKSRLNRARAELTKILFGTESNQYNTRKKN